jgi:hypothetical protein
MVLIHQFISPSKTNLFLFSSKFLISERDESSWINPHVENQHLKVAKEAMDSNIGGNNIDSYVIHMVLGEINIKGVLIAYQNKDIEGIPFNHINRIQWAI